MFNLVTFKNFKNGYILFLSINQKGYFNLLVSNQFYNYIPQFLYQNDLYILLSLSIILLLYDLLLFHHFQQLQDSGHGWFRFEIDKFWKMFIEKRFFANFVFSLLRSRKKLYEEIVSFFSYAKFSNIYF